MTFTEHLEKRSKECGCGILSPPTTYTEAFNFVCSYLLSNDFYVAGGAISNEQVNTEEVHAILFKYSRKYRKEYRKYIKGTKEGKKCLHLFQRLLAKMTLKKR